MRDIWSEITAWSDEGRRFAIARLMSSWGSAPRRPGAGMIIDDQGNVAGSVSGGCIEGAVIEAAGEVIQGDEPRELTFGIDNEKAWSIGLSCGGEVTVWIELHWKQTDPAAWRAIRNAVDASRTVIVATRIEPTRPALLAVQPCGSSAGTWSDPTTEVMKEIRDTYAAHTTCRVVKSGKERVFIQVVTRPDRLLIIGAGHIAVHLIALAHEVGFETVVIDPRKVFATNLRFPTEPGSLIADWPDRVLPHMNLHEDTYAVLLTHDPKIDDPALHGLLQSPVTYIGALGSRKTHNKRRNRLRKAGVREDAIQRIHGPVGLDIGAANPAEIALSIMAQVIAEKRARQT